MYAPPSVEPTIIVVTALGGSVVVMYAPGMVVEVSPSTAPWPGRVIVVITLGVDDVGI
jgi:hypothetical protein